MEQFKFFPDDLELISNDNRRQMAEFSRYFRVLCRLLRRASALISNPFAERE
jgi:hypothetical protein